MRKCSSYDRITFAHILFTHTTMKREVESLRKLVTKLNNEVEEVQQREKGLLQQIDQSKKKNEDDELKQQQQQISGDAKKLIDAGWTVAKVNTS